MPPELPDICAVVGATMLMPPFFFQPASKVVYVLCEPVGVLPE